MALIFEKIYLPIMAGEVHVIKAQRPIPFAEFKKICDTTPNSFSSCFKYSRGADPSEVVVFQFSISLKDEFIDNMTNIFDNISNSKEEFYGYEQIWNKYHSGGQSTGNSSQFMIYNNKSDNLSATVYTLDNYPTEIKTLFEEKFSTRRYRKLGST